MTETIVAIWNCAKVIGVIGLIVFVTGLFLMAFFDLSAPANDDDGDF